MERKGQYNAEVPLSVSEERETFIREDGSTYTREDIFVKLHVPFRDHMLATLKGPPLSVYLCIALHCNKNLTAYPSINTISRETGYSRTAVIEATKKLESMGLVQKTHRDDDLGDQDSNLYYIQGWVTMGRGSTSSLPPVVHLVDHGSTPGVPEEESIEEEPREEDKTASRFPPSAVSSSQEKDLLSPDPSSRRDQEQREDPHPPFRSPPSPDVLPLVYDGGRLNIPGPYHPRGAFDAPIGGDVLAETGSALNVLEWTAADVQHLEMIEGPDLDVQCERCDNPIPVRELRPAAGVCPHCGCPVQVASPNGVVWIKPPQKYREGYRPKRQGPTLGSLFERCPDPLKDQVVEKDQLAAVQVELGRDPWTFFEAVIWSAGKARTGVIQRALAALPKFKEGKSAPPVEQAIGEFSQEWLEKMG